MEDIDVEVTIKSKYATNDYVVTPFGVGVFQGWMRTGNTSAGTLVAAVRIPIDNTNREFLSSPNVVGKYKDNSPNAIWCFLSDSIEHYQPDKKGRG